MSAVNPMRGEAAFETEDGKAFKVVFDIDAIAALENLHDRPIAQIFSHILGGRVGYARDALFCGLRSHHPDLTRADAGDLMTNIKGAKAVELIVEALTAAFPKPKGGKAGEADPPKALGEDGTGTLS